MGLFVLLNAAAALLSTVLYVRTGSLVSLFAAVLFTIAAVIFALGD